MIGPPGGLAAGGRAKSTQKPKNRRKKRANGLTSLPPAVIICYKAKVNSRIEARSSCVPRDKARQPSRGRGIPPKERRAPDLNSWAAGEDSADCHSCGALFKRPLGPTGDVVLSCAPLGRMTFFIVFRRLQMGLWA